MLEARSVAVVGASRRTDSFGARMLAEVAKSAARPVIYPVNPRYREIGDRRCYPSLADLPEPVDLALLGVPDAALEQQLRLAAEHGCGSAVIFGNAHEDPQPPAPGPVPDPAPGAGTAAVSPRSASRQWPGTGPPSPNPGSVRAGIETGAIDAAAVPIPAGRPDRPGLRRRLADIAQAAGMELCGAGCMGFANVSHGLRAMGYVEPDPLPAGPIALVTHSGSVFSTLLRSRRALGFTLAVSSGQELVTAAPSYLSYALGRPETRVLGLVLEAMRQPARLRDVLELAARRDLPVVLLAAGGSATGRAMVAAHSGALAGTDGGWEALARAYGVHRVADLAELADTLELFALRGTRPPRTAPLPRPDPPRPDPPRPQPPAPQDRVGPAGDGGPAGDVGPAGDGGREPGAGLVRGIATVHDSGLERAHAADVADQVGIRFASIGEPTRARLAQLLDPGLVPANPLDVWGTGARTRELFGGSLTALAEDDSVDAVALAVDLVPELDGDTAYQLAALDAAARTDKPLAVISNLPAAIDPGAAALLRSNGIPVLESLRTGLLALRHLLDHQARPPATRPPRPAQPGQPGQGRPVPDGARLGRARRLLDLGRQTGAAQLALLREYGIGTARAVRDDEADQVLAAAARVGYPVVLKTDTPGIAHKSDAGGVLLGLATAAELSAAYADLAARLGPGVLVCEAVPPGTELALGIVRDPCLGPLIVVGAGGTLVELIADRAVALPPLSAEQAIGLLGELKVGKLLAGVRSAAPADLGAIAGAICGLAELASELGQDLDALDINPLICGPDGAIAVDVLVVRRQPL